MQRLKILLMILALLVLIMLVPLLKMMIPAQQVPVAGVPAVSTTPSAEIQVSLPAPGQAISSPLTVVGRVRGNWFFEASFPVFLVDWDGRIIAQTTAAPLNGQDWMTTDFVDFGATLTFDAPSTTPDLRRGSVILKNDNPSGMPENEKSIEIPITFR